MIQSCCLQSMMNTSFASQTKFSCLHPSYSVLYELDLPFQESSSSLHKRSCFSLMWLLNLNYIFIMKFLTFKVMLSVFLIGFVQKNLKAVKKGFKRGEIQSLYLIGQCFHPATHNFFLPKIFNHWEANFNNRKRPLYYLPLFFLQFRYTKFHL